MTPTNFEVFLRSTLHNDDLYVSSKVEDIVKEVAHIVLCSSMDSDLRREWVDLAIAEDDCE